MTLFKYGFLPLSAWLLSSVSTGLFAEETSEEEDDEDGMEEVRLLSTPVSSLSAGLAASSDDQTMLGRYNGRNDQGVNLLFDYDMRRRDDETGTWTLVNGRNVGLRSRNLRYERNRQGDWKYFIEFDQLDSVNPYLFETDLTGIGSEQMATGGTSSSRQFSLQRKNVKLGMSKLLIQELELTLSYRQEIKEGARNWGTGGRLAGTAFDSFFLVEPVDYRTQEVDVHLDYNTENFQLRGAYLLSLFDNSTEMVGLDISSIDNNASVVDTSTPPDNHSQLFYLSGGYRLSDYTRGTFKVSYQQDRQNENFYQSNPFNNRNDLGAKVDTSRINLGLSSRVHPDLTLKAKLRYEDRDDNTPQVQYLSSLGRYNQLSSRTNSNGSVNATYRLTPGSSLMGGVEIERRERDPVDEPNMSRRKRNDEVILQLGARRKLSELLNATLKYSHSDRDGSAWLAGSGVEAGTLLTAPQPYDYVSSLQYADRKRDQVRLMLDWYPADELSVQFVTEGSKETYSGLPLGPRDGNTLLASIDSSYQLSDEWSLNGWLSVNRHRTEATSHSWIDINTANFATAYAGSLQTWEGQSEDSGFALGLGVKGLASDELKLGGSLQFSQDKSRFDMTSIDAPADFQYAPGASLPSIEYRSVQLKLYGEYALDEQHGLRMDYRYDRLTNNDWTWSNTADYDGTTVTQMAKDTNHFIGLSYYYRGW